MNRRTSPEFGQFRQIRKKAALALICAGAALSLFGCAGSGEERRIEEAVARLAGGDTVRGIETAMRGGSAIAASLEVPHSPAQDSAVQPADSDDALKTFHRE